MAGMVKVKFPAGKVHLAFGIYSGRASVLCNKVPTWHQDFRVIPEDEPITCPTCIRKGAH
jgi:hypothetical protein